MRHSIYGSGYFCPFHIGLWMIRLETFPSLHMNIQSVVEGVKISDMALPP
jgi:hypothetical protein